MSEQRPGRWEDGNLPANVRLGSNTVLKGDRAFRRFLGKRDPALIIGANATMDQVHFAVGRDGCITVGEYCYFSDATLLCEEAITIGNYVVIGWNTTIADSDFHPVDPALRIEDAIACSPLAGGRPRPKVACRPVVIEDDAWIGPNATILKGVRIGRGAIVDPGSVVTRDVPSGARVAGNPAEVIEGLTG